VSHYYSEWDPYAADWLRNLAAAGEIPAGTVDERSIKDVQAKDLEGVTQAHFFAGIGGWPLALRLAGWPGDLPVWTGSCPCQPFSVAGCRKGERDKRHVWPAFFSLIAERLPPVVFGEQVASPLGREWLSGVRSDLEGLGYAVGGGDLPAACVSAPQLRQRLFWVASSTGWNPGDREVQRGWEHRFGSKNGSSRRRKDSHVGDDGLRGLGCASGVGLQGHEQAPLFEAGRREEGGATSESSSAPRYWDAFDTLQCADGKARRIEPGTFPLAHGVPARLGKLRAYGNAIVPQVAAEFVRAYMEPRGIAKV
jgi:DNA (cytosine-5)-methyltransferase 1